MKIKKQPSIKDLKTTLNVLATLDTDVPDALLISISEQIQQREKQQLTRKLNRMSEEELIRFESRQRKILRILLPDGRLIQAKTNDATFILALKEIGKELISQTAISVRQHPMFMYDESETRQRLTKYYLLMPGVFVYAKTTSAEKKRILERIDEKFSLNWSISLI